MKLYLLAKHWDIVKNILSKYPYTFYAFGSRVKGTQRKTSDLDLCFMDNIPLHERTVIKEAFENSDLPFTVDLVDFNQCDEKFQTLIKADMIKLNLAD